MTEVLSSARRAAFKVLATTLIPESEEGPSADEVEVAEIWIDEILSERPDLVPTLLNLLDSFDIRAEPRVFLEQMENEDRGQFSNFTYLVTAAFFRSPLAQNWLGSGRILDEYEGADEEPTAATKELLAPVKSMTPFYRATELQESENA